MSESSIKDIGILLALCEGSKSFGDVLLGILDDNDIPQKRLAELINYSGSHVNRIVNGQLPDNMHIEDVRRIAEVLHCSNREWAQLTLAFTCHFLSRKGLLGLGGADELTK